MGLLGKRGVRNGKARRRSGPDGPVRTSAHGRDAPRLSQAGMEPPDAVRVLILEDSAADAEVMARALRDGGFGLKWERVETRSDYLSGLLAVPDVILADYRLPAFSGIEALKLLRERGLDIPFIIVSGTISDEQAAELIKEGASDFLLKDRLGRLGSAVRTALDLKRTRDAGRRAQLELQQLAALVESSQDAIVSRRLDGTILTWNPAAERLFGWTAGEAVGRDASMIVPPEREAEVALNREKSGRGIVVPPFDTIRMAKDGRRIDVSVTQSLVKNEAGEVTAVSFIFRDITQRKQLDQALRESEERLRATFEQAAVGIALRSIEPRNPRWLRVNRKLCDIFGYSEEELLQLTSVDLTPPGDRDLAVDYNEKMLRGEITTYSREKRYMRKDGRIIWTNLSVTAVRGPGGGPSHVISVIEDITERKEAEDKIRRLNRVYAVLSGINTLIVRTRDRHELLREACRIAVEQGRFGVAWIGTRDPATSEVAPVAWAGSNAAAIAKARSSVGAGSPEREGVTGRAITQKQAVYNNDIAVEPEFGSDRRREAIRLGYRSVVGLPLVVEGTAVGAFTLYAREPNFFNDEELELLNELAADISFAITHIAQQEKLEKLSRIRAVSSQINAAIVRIKERHRLLQEMFGIIREDGKFEMTWIATVDSDKKEVRPVAWSGFSAQAAHAVSWATISAARGAIGQAIQTRRVVVRNDIEAELPAGKLRDEALKQGYHSTICLPLVADGRVAVAVILFGRERGFFDTDEIALLTEVANDVSFALEHIGKSEKLDYLAYYDALTGLANRTLIEDRLGRIMRRAKDEGTGAAVVMCDIKHLRQVNESFGRQAGDMLMRTVGERLQRIWPEPDNLGHIGGGCFAGLMPGIKDAADIAHLIEKFFAGALSRPVEIGGRELRIALTAGIALFPVDGEETDTLLHNAEAALKKAKAAGERYLFYHPQMNAAVAETLLLENKLRRAVEVGQFVLHYQPKIHLVTGAVSGLEALIRWNDPETGLVSPAKFVPLLEETGLILEVGRWAMRTALSDHREWSRQGLQPPRIAVNASPVQLRHKDFVAVVRETIEGPEPHGLDLEITESLLMENIEDNIEKLRAVRDMGIDVAVDDFGTGYSSLGYLAKLPINALKIDRSFIVNMADSPDSMSIVSTIISLAHSLNLKVVAEGVETQEQSKFLKLLKCDEIQGYLISRPLPAQDIVSLLRQRSDPGVEAANPPPPLAE